MTDLVVSRGRLRSAAPFLVCGLAGVVAGGLLAAMTAPLDLVHGAWAAAYLVLVVGVAQIAFGTAQAALAVDVPPVAGRGRFELVSWNLGSFVVIGGTFAETPWLVAIGSALLVVALILFMTGVTGAGRSGSTLLYRGFAGFLALSVAVGTLLSVLRH